MKNTDKKGPLHYLYRTRRGRIVLKILTKPVVSKSVGKFMDSRLSKGRIKSFIRKNNIKVSEFEERKYKSYNDFFTRKIKPGMRVIDMVTTHLISPCDSKLSVYKIEEGSIFFIKGSAYQLCDLLDGNEIYKNYNNGYCMIFRLAVDNYHRYCYIDDGTKGDNTFIKGEFHTVQPIALERYNIYKRNSREYTVLCTENFGDIVQIEVGAMMVGRIVNHHNEYSYKRGEEKGMFEFGGSTVVLLVKANTIKVDENIIANSEKGCETAVKYGQRVGQQYE